MNFFCKAFLAAVIIVISGCIAQNKPSDKNTIRVMTYNIHHANPPAENKNVINLQAIADVIKKSGATLVAIQELDSVTARSGNVYQLRELAKLVNMHYYFAKAIAYEGGGYGVGILSEYSLSEAATYSLPKLSGDKSEDRVIAVAKVDLPGKKDIYFAATHLDVTKEANRELQVERIIEIMSAKDIPVILGGDMNATTESASIKTLEKYFINASAKNNPTIPVINPAKKIDFIFYTKENDFKLTAEKVMTDASYESDHLPFWVDLMMKK